jgi:hypothetical protein
MADHDADMLALDQSATAAAAVLLAHGEERATFEADIDIGVRPQIDDAFNRALQGSLVRRIDDRGVLGADNDGDLARRRGVVREACGDLAAGASRTLARSP